MKKSGFLVCLVVGFLGLLAAVLDFVAEAKRVRDFKVIEEPNNRINFPTCGHPKSHSVALGITSALVLLVAELLVIAAAGCVCCCGSPYQSTCKRIIAIICLLFSWVTLVFSIGLLLFVIIFKDHHTIRVASFGDYYCTTTKSGFYLGGAVLALVTVTLGIIYYILTSEGKRLKKRVPTPMQNIPMAQPYSGQP